MKGIITSFRRSKHVQHHRQMIIAVEGIESKDKTKQLLGKGVVWKSPAGKEIKGKISLPHGSNGFVRAIFEKGMPGQCLGKKIDIL